MSCLMSIKYQEGDRIVDQIVEGHKEKDIGIIHYEHITAPDPPTIPVEELSDVLDQSIIKGLNRVWISQVY